MRTSSSGGLAALAALLLCGAAQAAGPVPKDLYQRATQT
jgi:hypothetical protein